MEIYVGPDAKPRINVGFTDRGYYWADVEYHGHGEYPDWEGPYATPRDAADAAQEVFNMTLELSTARGDDLIFSTDDLPGDDNDYSGVDRDEAMDIFAERHGFRATRVGEVSVGDRLDLQGDIFADPDRDNVSYEFEMVEVTGNEAEGPDCVRLEFEAEGTSCGFPRDHYVRNHGPAE
jgi:hypothetical protein